MAYNESTRRAIMRWRQKQKEKKEKEGKENEL
jgi:hypothetical protein